MFYATRAIYQLNQYFRDILVTDTDTDSTPIYRTGSGRYQSIWTCIGRDLKLWSGYPPLLKKKKKGVNEEAIFNLYLHTSRPNKRLHVSQFVSSGIAGDAQAGYGSNLINSTFSYTVVGLKIIIKAVCLFYRLKNPYKMCYFTSSTFMDFENFLKMSKKS